MGAAERPGSGVTGGTGGTGGRGIALIAVAFILGVVLLNKFDRGSAPFSERVENDNSSTTRGLPTAPVVPSTSGRPPRPAEEVKVLPANATDTAGLGGRTNEFLRRAGYNALAPIDATRTLDATLVEYRDDFEPEARALAQLLQLPVSAVRPLEENPPVGDTRGADVLVVIGNDLKLPETTSTTRR